jgi:hypothetical protein
MERPMPRTEAVQVPGETADTSHSVDAALEAAARGGTHRVKKHRDAPPAPTVDDPLREPGVGINAKPGMSYDEAMAAFKAGTLTRSVLTEQGWVCPPELPNDSHRKPVVRSH